LRSAVNHRLRQEGPTVIALLIVLPLATLLVAVMSQLGGNGRLPRNGSFGLRIPSTMASDEAWRAGHHAAARPAWIGFGVIAIVAILALLLPTSIAGVVIVAAIFLITVVWSVVAASHAARVDSE
jgi:ABC-type sugar transport system permease subunit